MRAFFYYIVITPNAAKKYAKKLHKNLVNPKKSSTFAPSKLKYIRCRQENGCCKGSFFIALVPHRKVIAEYPVR